MIKNLLARLLANLKPGNLGLRPHTLSANFAPDSLIAHRSQHNLLERSILHLAPGEAAYLIIKQATTRWIRTTSRKPKPPTSSTSTPPPPRAVRGKAPTNPHSAALTSR